MIEAAAAERGILGAADLLLVALGHSFSLLLLLLLLGDQCN